MECIQSAHNETFKSLRKLVENRRERLKTASTLLDGTHLLTAWLDAGKPLLRLIVSESALDNPEIQQILNRTQAVSHVLSTKLFAELSDLPSQSGILAQVEIPPASAPRRDGFCLLLDGVQDPGNVGAILRTAVAAGVQQALLSPACADVWSPKTLRAGMGAQAILDIVERADLLEFAENFKGNIAATLLDGATPLFQTDLTGSLALVLGAEGSGVNPALADKAKVRIKIPMAHGIESLNVGAAAAICMYERVRQLSLVI